jgi:transposase
MLAESHDEEQIIARVAALDIGKAELVCCVRLAAQRGPKRLQEVSTHSTMTRSLTELASRLVELGVQRVVMEATSDYWKPVFYLLEAHGLIRGWSMPATSNICRAAEERRDRRGLVVQARRATDAAPQFRTAVADPAAA